MPKEIHAGSKSDFGEELDVEKIIKRNRCHREYYNLEDCLADFNRDWRKCQDEVKKLKQCNNFVNRLRKAQEASKSKT
ncbi:hypothetical protein CCR75_008201 [Bremia lactucae]|uniref:CHCH domain-containing protein n=1 Tax=Bremia lactucae TaxID=4779 RepID=A0A976IDC7_BRELC|nr:hypothetical protein CCR75_008201 [Bremia lactucae]